MQLSRLFTVTVLFTVTEARGTRKIKGIRTGGALRKVQAAVDDPVDDIRAPGVVTPAAKNAATISPTGTGMNGPGVSVDGLPAAPETNEPSVSMDGLPAAPEADEPGVSVDALPKAKEAKASTKATKATKDDTVTADNVTDPKAKDTKAKETKAKDAKITEDTVKEKKTKIKDKKCKKREPASLLVEDDAAVISQITVDASGPAATPVPKIPKGVVTATNEAPVVPPSFAPVADSGIVADAVAVADDVDYCPLDSIVRSEEECSSLRQGILPTEHDVVEGEIQFELTSEEADAMQMVTEVLRKDTAVIAAGCYSNQNRRWLQEENSTDFLSISGVHFESFQTRDDCVNSEGTSCDAVRALVDVYYEGDRDATDEEKEAMLAVLLETIDEQAYGGAFGNYTSIDNLEAAVMRSSSGGGGLNKAATGSFSAAGALLGLILVLGGILYYQKKRSGDVRDSTSHRRFV